MIRINTLASGCLLALLASGCSALTKWPDVNDNTAKKTGGSGGDDAVGGSVNKGGATSKGGVGGVGGSAVTAGRNGSGGGTTSAAGTASTTAGTASTSGGTGTSLGGDTSVGGNANVSGGATNAAGTGPLIGGTSNQGGSTTGAGGATGSGGTTTLSGGTTSVGGTAATAGGTSSTGLGGQGGGAIATGGSATSGGSTAIGTGGGAGATLAIATPTLATGRTGVAYSGTVTASGASQYTWSIASGSLPSGVSLQNTTSATVTIAGTPSAAGLYPFQLAVTDGTSNKTIDLSLEVTHRIAFLADRTVAGRQELFVTNVGVATAGTPVKVNAAVTSSISDFKWSPDGTRLAYLVNNELFVVVAVNPGIAMSVGTGVSIYDWLKSGETLAVGTSAGTAYLVDVSGSTVGAQQAIVLPAAATGLTKSVGPLYPSPVGRALAVQSCDVLSSTNTIKCYVHYVNWAQGGSVTTVELQQLGQLGWTGFSSDGVMGVTDPYGPLKFFNLSTPAAPTSVSYGTPYRNSVQIDPTSHSVFWTYTENALSRIDAYLYSDASGTASNTLIVSRGSTVSAGPWSPDGKNVLLKWGNDLRTIANVKSAAANADTTILADGFLISSTTDIPAYDWSPDSNWVAVKADKTTNAIYDLFLVRWPGPGSLTAVSAMTVGSGVGNWKFAPNSSAVAFVGTAYSASLTSLLMSTLPSTGAANTAIALTSATDPSVRTDISWLPGSRMVLYRAADSGGDQLHGIHISTSGIASAPLSLTGATTGTGVTAYTMAPLP